MAGGRKSKPATRPRPANTFVLDNGAHTLKAGFASSSGPLPRVIPNCLARDRQKRIHVSSDLENCVDFGEIQFRRPVDKGYIVNWEAQKQIWDREFFDEGAPQRCDPTDTRLLLSEAPNSLPSLQTNCDQIVFEEYQFSSYYRGSGPAWNAYTDVPSIFRPTIAEPEHANTHHPAEVLLLIDCGYSHTTVTPLLSGRPLQSVVRRLDIGGKLMTNHLTRLLSMRHFDMRSDTYLVNDIKEAACYVSQDFNVELDLCWKGTRGERRESHLAGGGIAKDYILPDFHIRKKGVLVEYDPVRHTRSRKSAVSSGGRNAQAQEEDLITLRNERFTVPEILFNPSDIGLRQPGLADAVMQSLAELPVGLWPSMLSNILLIGGCAQIPGMVNRLQSEILQRAPDECLVRVASPENPIVSTWLGGVGLAQHKNIEQLAITKQEYEEHGSAWAARHFAAGLVMCREP